jgi:Protein kinase domain
MMKADLAAQAQLGDLTSLPQQPLVEPLRRWDPEQVGGFVLLGRLGAGAMGQVYLARSAAGRLVAVKTIKAELAEEPDFRNRFGQEVAAARRVSGAFTAAVVAADSEADVPWLATVYVPAPSLQRLVRSCGPLAVPPIRWLAAGCAEALESIHSVGLVHRDLKPANVLVAADGPRVIDFGVARAAERIQLTVTHGSIGTPAYMAPEQARDTRQATSASDIFSLGATMLFAATGHAPYQGDTVMDVLVQLATGPPDLAGLPPELAEIVAACLERDPRNRPTSASILARLAPSLSGEPGAPPLSPAALALIEEYRQIPRASAAPGAGDGLLLPARADVAAAAVTTNGNEAVTGDATIGSQPIPAGPARPAAPGPPAPDRDFRRRVMLTAATVAAAVLLVAAGWVIRIAVSGSPSLAAGNQPAAGTSAPSARTSSVSPDTSPVSASTTPVSAVGSQALASGGGPPPSWYREHGLGPVMGPPPGAPGAPGGRGVTLIDLLPNVPFVGLSADTGDPDTDFVVIGLNWPAGSTMTITLGGRSSPVHPQVDGSGMFNYVINQTHEFFRGALPPGTYTVRVTDAQGASAAARFIVIAPG